MNVYEAKVLVEHDDTCFYVWARVEAESRQSAKYQFDRMGFVPIAVVEVNFRSVRLVKDTHPAR